MSCTRNTLLVALATATALMGCATSYDKLVQRAEVARKRGDLLSAARSYRNACHRADRMDDPACIAAREVAARAVARELRRAEKPCRAGDHATCGRYLAPVRELAPHDPTAAALRSEVGAAHARACSAATPEKGAVALAREAVCLHSAEAVVSSSSYTARVLTARRRAAAAFYALSRAPSLAPFPGARMLLLDAALAHADQIDVRALFEDTRAEFRKAAMIPARATLTSFGPGSPGEQEDTCVAIEIGPGVRCVAGESSSPGLSVNGTLRMSPMQVERFVEQKSTRYQSGFHRTPNPAYEVEQRRAERADQALQAVERDLVETRLACEEAQRQHIAVARDASASAQDRRAAREQQERDCRYYAEIATLHDARSEQWRRAQAAANDTPAMLEEPAFEVHHWATHHYEWTAPFIYSVEAGDAPREADDVVRLTAQTQPGFAPAGIPAKPLDISPTPFTMYQTARERTLDALRAIARESLRLRAERRRRGCAGAVELSGPWLQCWAEATLWSGTLPRAAQLLGGIL